jgi:hypothetical protein
MAFTNRRTTEAFDRDDGQTESTSLRCGVFVREGRRWRLGIAGTEVVLPDLVGLHYLAVLIAHPGERLRPLDLTRLVPIPVARESLRRGALSPAERARFRVSYGIRRAQRQISLCHTSLARHLGAAVRTGTLCSYDPAPESRVVWRIGESAGGAASE